MFAVIQRDRNGPLALARGEADRIAATIPEDATASSDSITGPRFGDDLGGFEDEDYELQAALQASMMNASGSEAPVIPPPLQRQTVPLPGGYDTPLGPSSGPHTPLFQTHSQDYEDDEVEEEPIDPVAASMARNRHLLQQITAEQQYAQRELASQGFAPRNESDDYEEQLRRAIAESQALARASGSNTREDEDVDMEVQAPATPPPRQSSPPLGTFVGGGDRVYDDDDAELQAALKASLEHVPEGWAPPPDFSPSRRQSAPTTLPAAVSAPAPVTQVEDDTESVLSEDTVPSSDAGPPTAAEAPVDVDEMRRRRLARFGG